MGKRINVSQINRREKISGILKKKDGKYIVQTKFGGNPEVFEVLLEEIIDDFVEMGVDIKIQESPWADGMFVNPFPEGNIEFNNINIHPDYKYATPEAYEKFQDMKFGMMIHWGINSQLGVTESWCANGEMTEQEFLDIYYTLWQVFNPVEFNAKEWADLAELAGMQFFQFTTKHHDGFCMYDTKTIKKSRKRTPSEGPMVGTVENAEITFSIMDTLFKRDIVKELVDEFRKRNLGIGLYYSNIDWNDPSFRWHKGSRLYDPEYGPDSHPKEWKTFISQQKQQLKEIFSNYGEIDQIFFDGSWPFIALKEMEDIILMCRELQPECMMSDRGLGPYGDFTSPERWIPKAEDDNRLSSRTQKFWQVCDPIHGSWAYLPNDKYKGPEELLRNLVDAISKGGTYVFGVSPMPNGRFPKKTIERMKYMGDWLKINGESIYSTRKWIISRNEEQDLYFTQSKDSSFVYIICFNQNIDEITLDNISIDKVNSIEILGITEEIKWKENDSSLRIQIPIINNMKGAAFTFKLKMN